LTIAKSQETLHSAFNSNRVIHSPNIPPSIVLDISLLPTLVK
jgi:hypothetical protein